MSITLEESIDAEKILVVTIPESCDRPNWESEVPCNLLSVVVCIPDV